MALFVSYLFAFWFCFRAGCLVSLLSGLEFCEVVLALQDSTLVSILFVCPFFCNCCVRRRRLFLSHSLSLSGAGEAQTL